MEKGTMKNAHRETLNCLPTYAAKTAHGWGTAHLRAIAAPKAAMEQALVEMLSGWLRYADAVGASWDSDIGSDQVLGPCWAQIGAGLRGLLNGDLGRLDGGTLDAMICGALQKERFDPEAL